MITCAWEIPRLNDEEDIADLLNGDTGRVWSLH